MKADGFKILKRTAEEAALAFTEASTNRKLLKIVLTLFNWAGFICNTLVRSHFQGLKCKHMPDFVSILTDVAQPRELNE